MTVISWGAALLDLGQANHCLVQMEDTSFFSLRWVTIFISPFFLFTFNHLFHLSCIVSKSARWWSKALWTEWIFLIVSMWGFPYSSPCIWGWRHAHSARFYVLVVCWGLCSYCTLRFLNYDYNLCFMQNSSRILWRNPAPQQPQGHPLCHQLLHHHRPWRTHVSQLLKPHNFDLLPWDGLLGLGVFICCSTFPFTYSTLSGGGHVQMTKYYGPMADSPFPLQGCKSGGPVRLTKY